MDWGHVLRNSEIYWALTGLRETFSRAWDADGSSEAVRVSRHEPTTEHAETALAESRLAQPLLPPARKVKTACQNSLTWQLLTRE
jgi:hypothetical protein